MYVTSGKPCESGPLPAGYGDAARNEQLNLSKLIAAAQGAVDLSTFRPDLNPNGMPWGTQFPPSVLDWLRNAGDFVAGAVSVGIPLPGKFDGGGGGVIPGTTNGNGTPSNPRVVDVPYCTPLTTAQQYTTPQRHDACGGSDGLVITSQPQAPPPTVQHTPQDQAITPTPFVPAPGPRRPSGDLCADLRDGLVLQSQVPIETVYECAQRGYRGVAPSPLNVVIDGLNGLGLGSCANPNVCAGNPLLVSESPADKARRGGDGLPLWMFAVIGIGLYAATKGTK